MKWIKTSDGLPAEGRYVLVRLNKTNWDDSDDPDGVYYKVAKLKKGISLEERADMQECERKTIYRLQDQWVNNKAPYAWITFGPSSYFSQEVTHWMEFDRIE